MKLKNKLAFGLGFLFIIIFVLTVFFCYYVQKLSMESGNILKDNYDSIVYSKNMFFALDDMRDSITGRILDYDNGKKHSNEMNIRIFETAKIKFEKNLDAENGNITEINETEYVESLRKNYDLFLTICGRIMTGPDSKSVYSDEFLPVYAKLRQIINDINDINMQAVVRKNQETKKDSSNIISYMAIIGTICLILAFGYFWYFPFYISNSISYLSDKMKELLQKADIKLDINSDDETHIILQSINLIENKILSGRKEK